MTLGNRIQQCRKALGLSQEELGQKLLVSRQTVSLWEKDQTLPSIDNLTRLKEIFGISVDELLGVETALENVCHAEVDKEPPREEYAFQINEKELKEAFDAHTQYRQYFYLPLFYLTCLFIISILDFPLWSILVFVSFFICSCIIGLVNFLKFQKQIDKDIHNAIQYSCITKIYNEYVEESAYKDGKFDNLNKFPFSNLSHAKDTGNLITAICKNRMLIFRKSALKEDSLIYSKLDIKDCVPKKRKLKMYSLLLFVSTLLSVLVGVACIIKLPDIIDFDTTPYWIFFLFLPLPIFSIYFGFSTKRTVGRYTKNIVAGIIVSVILFTFGSCSFLLSEPSNIEKCIRKIEEHTGIAVPEYKSAKLVPYGDEIAQFENGIFHQYITFELYGDKSNKFEETLVHDSRWMKEIPSDLEELIILDDEFVYNYLLMCNTDTGEINTPPEKSGYYDIFVIFYNVQSDKMLVYEYEIKYTK